MKKLIFLLVTALIFCSCTSNVPEKTPENTPEQTPEQPQYKVVYEKETVTSVFGDKTNVYKSEYKYDEKGNALSEIHYDSYGAIISEHRRSYDENYNLIHYVFIGNSTSSYIEFRYEYENNNMILSQSLNENGEIVSETHYEYDAHGNTIHQQVLGGEEFFVEYDYDGEKILEKRFLEPNKQLSYKVLYEYDASGNNLCETEYAPDMTLLRRIKREFDERGNMLTCFYYGQGLETQSKAYYTYDEKDNMLTYVRFSPTNALERDEKYVYNQQGFVIKETVFDGSDTRITEKDQFGNSLQSFYYNSDGAEYKRETVTYENPVSILIEQE